MAELSLILTLDLAALATAGWASRWLSRHSPGDGEAQRLTRALRSAADGIARKQVAQLLWSSLAAVLLCAVASWVFSSPALLWFGFGGAAGGLACFVVGQLVLSLSMTASALAARVLASADSALVVALRSSCASVCVSLVGALLCGAGLLLFTMQSGPTEHGFAGVMFVGGAVSGAMFAAILNLMSGAALRVAGITSRRSTREAATQPFHWVETRNPSLILDLISPHIGIAIARAQMLFCACLLLQLIAVTLPPQVLLSTAGTAQAPLAALLCVQAAALVCHGAISLTLRADDSARSWVTVLWRGQLAAAALAICAVVGTALWLVPLDSRSETLWCGTTGVATSLLTSLVAARTCGRTRPLEERALGSAPELFSALQAALTQAPMFLLIIGVGLALPYSLAATFPSSVHNLFWLTLGATAALPYLAHQAFVEPILDASTCLSSLRQDAGRHEPKAQLAALSTVSTYASTNAHRFTCLLTSLCACIAVSTSVSTASTSTNLASLLPSALQMAVLAAFGATIFISLGLGLFIRQAVRATQTGLVEVQRQLRAAAESGADGNGLAKPGYSSYLEQTTSSGLSNAPAQCGALVLLFVGLCLVGVQYSTTPGDGTWLAQLSLLAFSATVGITASLACGGVASHLALVQGFRRKAVGSASAMAPCSTGFRELAGTTVAPAALLLVHLATALSLIVPLMFT